ncbi:MAG: hypothetical protein M1833_006932 [Piccolia ochrophora]|nr:MAG: hypothetical protein M1833_006932 [Piccolia ochrophora]
MLLFVDRLILASAFLQFTCAIYLNESRMPPTHGESARLSRRDDWTPGGVYVIFDTLLNGRAINDPTDWRNQFWGVRSLDVGRKLYPVHVSLWIDSVQAAIPNVPVAWLLHVTSYEDSQVSRQRGSNIVQHLYHSLQIDEFVRRDSQDEVYISDVQPPRSTFRREQLPVGSLEYSQRRFLGGVIPHVPSADIYGRWDEALSVPREFRQGDLYKALGRSNAMTFVDNHSNAGVELVRKLLPQMGLTIPPEVDARLAEADRYHVLAGSPRPEITYLLRLVRQVAIVERLWTWKLLARDLREPRCYTIPHPDYPDVGEVQFSCLTPRLVNQRPAPWKTYPFEAVQATSSHWQNDETDVLYAWATCPNRRGRPELEREWCVEEVTHVSGMEDRIFS